MWFSGETPEQLESCEVRGPRVKGGRLEDGEAATLPETNIFAPKKKTPGRLEIPKLETHHFLGVKC